MIIVLHIFIALASLVYTTYLFVMPAESRFRPAYALVGLTLVSGVYLVASKPAALAHMCVSGLIYLGVVSVGIVAARAKLTRLG
jgi:hypothetical protein